MQRALVPALLTLAVLAIAPAAQAATRPQAALVSCDKVHHAAVFEGRMDTRPGSARMQMRFQLQDQRARRALGARRRPGLQRLAVLGDRPVALRVHEDRRRARRPGVLPRRRPLPLARRRRDRAASRHGRLRRVPPARPAPDLSVTALEVRPARASRGAATRSRSPTPAARPRRRRGSRSTSATAARRWRRRRRARSGRGADRRRHRPRLRPRHAVDRGADATDVVDEHDEDDDTFALSCPAPAA